MSLTSVAMAFLTARWENLILLNYRCPSDLLARLVPKGTELDDWRGEHLISLVGFQFLDTKLVGIPLLGYRSFIEVNLRFYVRRQAPEGVRRGVVFVRELVPAALVATAARLLYNEPYQTIPMSSAVAIDPTAGGRAAYSWAPLGSRHELRATARGPAQPLAPSSEAEFITEHYWGYNRRRSGRTLEYRVDHPKWLVWTCDDASYTRPAGSEFYGSGFDTVLAAEPVSAFLALGSEVAVYRGTRLDTA